MFVLVVHVCLVVVSNPKKSFETLTRYFTTGSPPTTPTCRDSSPKFDTMSSSTSSLFLAVPASSSKNKPSYTKLFKDRRTQQISDLLSAVILLSTFIEPSTLVSQSPSSLTSSKSSCSIVKKYSSIFGVYVAVTNAGFGMSLFSTAHAQTSVPKSRHHVAFFRLGAKFKFLNKFQT